ncbi:doublecortin domain-containing protein 2-like isoform X14 [Mytilus californianus]|uniref:doublecortin domain-containing protein 2-like isoform X14 n=1 Tax=Mytilus californianus TaxID=6549 RepID=UPI00224599F1|nr:doublecortin domain-containing protein 2-like isoform X14 [Mytilus californianus]
MRNGNYESEDEGGVEPHYQQGSTRGLYTYVYVNGDEHFLPKKLLVNPKRDRTYNAFLDYATKVLNPRYGAVRNIYTPEGRHRIRGFEDMQPDGRYVACGRERYKRLDRPYTQIEAPSPRRRNRHSNRDERLIPAHHNKHLENVTGKISQIPTQGKAIEVFVNGQDIDKPTTVGLSYRQLENMTEAIKVVHEAIREKHQYRVDQICDLEGHVVTDVNQLETGGLYVAKNSYHTFKPGRYEPHGRKNIIVPLSPRDKQQTKYLWKERSTFGGPGDYRRPRTLPPINSQKKHSPDHSVSSYPETRKRNQVNGVPVKAAKHTKRTPKQADYDKDDGGVFKAKGQSRDTRGAKEDERIKKERQGKAATKIQANYRGHQARKEVNDLKTKKETDEKKKKEDEQRAKQAKEENQAATKIQAGFRGHQARKEINQKKQVRDVKNSKEDAAAIKIQSSYRGHKARKEIADKKVKRTEKNTEEEAAATKIQAGFRGHKARQEINQKKQQREETKNEEEKAATKIQAGFRGNQARKEVDQKKKEKAQNEEEEKAATKIQAGFRGHQARKEVKKKKTKRLDGKTEAITAIQAAARGFLVRRRIEKRENTRQLLTLRSVAQEEVMDILGLIHERDKAATTIQSRYRGYRDRKEYKRIKEAN